jgi:hypothetical protein
MVVLARARFDVQKRGIIRYVVSGGNSPGLEKSDACSPCRPFAKRAARHIARFAIQRTPLSKKNKQRAYNLFAAYAVPARPVACRIEMPSGGEVSRKARR